MERRKAMSVPWLPPDALVGDPLYPRLKEHVVESTGLSYYTDKDPDLARRVSRRLSSLGVNDCAAYLNVLRDPFRGPPELDALVAEITIAETYFFRHREHFDALRDIVLPNIMARKGAHRNLRIWCAGCADGPEPYSLAILLRREMERELRGWEVTILGTDINRQGLIRAREGKFEEWAFRSTPEDLKRDCFRQEGRFWSIAPQYKECVSFQYHNLVEHSFPSLLNNLSAFDLIICRNVMIYFAPDLMRRLVWQFYKCLVPSAWFLVGPAEPNMSYFKSFRIVNAPGVTLYQKPEQSTGSTNAETIAITTCSPPILCVEFIANDELAQESPDPTIADVSRHADGGAWEAALQSCQQLLAKENLNATVQFYRALVLEHMAKHPEAEQSLRRAIYLDRKFVLAHYYLGLLLQSRGDPRQAERSFKNTLDLLLTRCDGDTFADADGITVAELRKLTKIQLEILGDRP
jgi:chemotaxis protein methyltransferase CheR